MKKPKTFNVQVELKHYTIKVLIDGLPHIVIDRKEYVGFQSWRDDDSMCIIEYYTKTNKITTEMDNVEKWKSILKALNDNL